MHRHRKTRKKAKRHEKREEEERVEMAVWRGRARGKPEGFMGNAGTVEGTLGEHRNAKGRLRMNISGFRFPS